jgi:uncharacterized protein (DUF58 family)
MTYGSGSISKLEYASYLSAAITHLMLNQRDGMGLVLFDEKIRKFIPPRAAPSHANIIMGALDNIHTGKDTQIRSTLDHMAERIKKRGLVILISDLLDDPEQVLMGLNHFRHNKQEMIVFHLLDRQEQVFQFGNRTKLGIWKRAKQSQLNPGTFDRHTRKSLNHFSENINWDAETSE